MIYIISFMILFLGVHFFQDFILNYFNSTVRYNLWDINLFFAVISLIICVFFKFASKFKNVNSQLAYIFLSTLFIKGALFFIVFQSTIFQLESLTIIERFIIIISLFIFLGLEVYFVVKIIKPIQV